MKLSKDGGLGLRGIHDYIKELLLVKEWLYLAWYLCGKSRLKAEKKLKSVNLILLIVFWTDTSMSRSNKKPSLSLSTSCTYHEISKELYIKHNFPRKFCFLNWKKALRVTIMILTSLSFLCSPYQLHVSEAHSSVSLLNGCDMSEFDNISHIPIKASNDFYTLGDIIANDQNLHGEHINIQAVVKTVSM